MLNSLKDTANRKIFSGFYYTSSERIISTNFWSVGTLPLMSKTRVMKMGIKLPLNPIHRDLILVLCISLCTAVALVSVTFMIFG